MGLHLTGPTTTQFNNAFARRVLIDANLNGVVADGTTNDTAAWQAIVDTAPAGSTITWTGRSMLDAPIIWKTKVSLIGHGWGKSVLATRGSTYFSAIQRVATDGGSTLNVIADSTFRDFEVDGSGLTGTAESINGKAIFIQFLKGCEFLNLYLHDTIGTALGTDFMPDCLIEGNRIERAGRNWAGSLGGQAGIGVGAGAWAVESVRIVNNDVVDCGHWGIFVEQQNGQPYRSRGARITGNTVSGTKGVGIGDSGCTETLIQGNHVSNSGTINNATWRDGIQVSLSASDTQILDNVSTDNAGNGIASLSSAGDGVVISGNKVYRNARRGIDTAVSSFTRSGYSIRNNEVRESQFDGIYVNATTGSMNNLAVQGNRCYNNGLAGTSGYEKGIQLAANCDISEISGNVCYDNQATKTQKHGIVVSLGTWTNARISGNNLAGNATAGLRTVGATLTSAAIRGNVGWVTENSGAGTVAAASATVAVTHGLSATPTSITVTPQANEGVWVTTIGASTFTVNRAVTTNALPFAWRAEV